MNHFFKKHLLLFCLIILLILAIGTPLVLQYVFKINKGHWNSFWGDYLGIIPAGIISAILILLERYLNKVDKTNDKWNALYIELLELKNNHVKHLEFLFSDEWSLNNNPDNFNKKLFEDSVLHCKVIIEYSEKKLAPFIYSYSAEKGFMEDPFSMQFHVLSASIQGLLLSKNYHPEKIIITTYDNYAKDAVANFEKLLAGVKEKVTI